MLTHFYLTNAHCFNIGLIFDQGDSCTQHQIFTIFLLDSSINRKPVFQKAGFRIQLPLLIRVLGILQIEIRAQRGNTAHLNRMACPLRLLGTHSKLLIPIGTPILTLTEETIQYLRKIGVPSHVR